MLRHAASPSPEPRALISPWAFFAAGLSAVWRLVGFSPVAGSPAVRSPRGFLRDRMPAVCSVTRLAPGLICQALSACRPGRTWAALRLSRCESPPGAAACRIDSRGAGAGHVTGRQTAGWAARATRTCAAAAAELMKLAAPDSARQKTRQLTESARRARSRRHQGFCEFVILAFD